jgi:microcystin-dependent protein
VGYPSLYQRLFNFARDAMQGLVSPAPAKVDAELNNIQVSLSQVRDAVKAITTADGRLKNVASALAQALVGTWAGTSAGVVTFVTTIPFQAAMSTSSVLVMVNTTMLRPAQITSVQSNAGFLEVTLAVAPANGATLVVWAFEPGAGLLTQLGSTAAGDGASLIGLEDALGELSADNVEDAIAELASEYTSLITAIGDLGTYFKADGSVVATGDFDLDGNKVTGAADATDPSDYVTLGQIQLFIDNWADLSAFFVKRDGTTAMAGPFNFGNNKGIELADPDLAQPLDAVNVRAMLKAIATSGAAPIGTVVDYVGATAPTNWLLCDGQAYLTTAYPLLDSILSGVFKTGAAQGAVAATMPAVVTGNLTAGAINNTYDAADGTPILTGVGYATAPTVTCVNTDGGAAVTGQPTYTISVTPVVADGPNVTGGVVSIAITAGTGTGIRAGAIFQISNTLTPLPAGYFRTPDLRGRVSLGAGTESKSFGITDPPDITKGDPYNATLRSMADRGGEEKHKLTVAELARHSHGLKTGDDAGGGNIAADGTTTFQTISIEYTGGDSAHNTMPPFFVLNKIIKAA